MRLEQRRTNSFASPINKTAIGFKSASITAIWKPRIKSIVREARGAERDWWKLPFLFADFSRWHHNARFSTYDHYATNANCPQQHGGGGWWYHSGLDCAHVQLNGRLATHSDGLVPFNTGILWIGWKSDRHYSFQRVTMAIQPKSKHARPLYRT